MKTLYKRTIFHIILFSFSFYFNLDGCGQDIPINTISIQNTLENISKIDISPDGNVIAVNGDSNEMFEELGNAMRRDSKLLTLNARTLKLNWLYDSKIYGTYCSTIHISPDNSKIMSGFFPGTVLILDAIAGNIIHTITSDAPFKPYGLLPSYGVLFFSDSSKFVTIDPKTYDGYQLPYRVWDIASGDLDSGMTKIFRGNIGSFPSPTLYNDVILSATEINSVPYIELYDLIQQKSIYSFPGKRPVVSSNLRYVAYYRLTEDGINVMDLKTFKDITKVDTTIALDHSDVMTVSNQGVVAIAGIAKPADIYVISEPYARKIIAPNPLGIVYEYPLVDEKDSYYSNDTQIEFFPDGQRFLTVNGTDINIWDIRKITTAVQDSRQY